MDRERLLVVLDRLLGLAESAVDNPEGREGRALASSVPHFAVNRKRLLVVLDRLLGLAELPVDNPEVHQDVAFARAVLHLAVDRERLLVVFDRLLDPAEIHVDTPEAHQGVALEPPTPHFAVDRKRLFVVCDRLLDLAEIAVDNPEVREGRALASPVPDLAVDRKRLLVVLDRLVGLAELPVDTPESPQDAAFAPAVLHLAVDRERLLVVFDRLLGLAEIPVDNPEVPQDVAFALAVLQLAVDLQGFPQDLAGLDRVPKKSMALAEIVEDVGLPARRGLEPEDPLVPRPVPLELVPSRERLGLAASDLELESSRAFFLRAQRQDHVLLRSLGLEHQLRAVARTVVVILRDFLAPRSFNDKVGVEMLRLQPNRHRAIGSSDEGEALVAAGKEELVAAFSGEERVLVGQHTLERRCKLEDAPLFSRVRLLARDEDEERKDPRA